MYADGGAEDVVGEAIAGRRGEVFIVTKVLPENSSRSGTLAACARSLKRLKTDYADLYLLHWRGRFPLADTLAAFLELQEKGATRYWGVSNFDVEDMEELFALAGGKSCAANQVVYNLKRRGIEADLVPWSRERAVPIMAYSPIEQGRLSGNKTLAAIAVRHRATPAQIALAWVLRQRDMMVIPKAGSEAHVRENRAALDIDLTEADLGELDRAFPPPKRPRPLEML
jgi:diketogulonate reductase-like aldo/keto reductase